MNEKMWDEIMNEGGEGYNPYRMNNQENTGLRLESRFCDDAAESRHFTGEANALEVQPEPATVQIRVGYDLAHHLYLHEYKTMAEQQDAFDRDSCVYEVSSLDEFRAAVIDGAVVAEQKRIAHGDAIVASFTLPDKPRTKKIWDWIRSRESGKRPPVHVFLSTPKRGRRDGRRFIMGDERVDHTPWHWGGFDIAKIDWPLLYDQLLRTERHRKNLDLLCGSIAEGM